VNGGEVGDEGEESAERERRHGMQGWRVLRAMVRAVQLMKTGRRIPDICGDKVRPQAYLGSQ
jgi:hypothetical protein